MQQNCYYLFADLKRMLQRKNIVYVEAKNKSFFKKGIEILGKIITLKGD